MFRFDGEHSPKDGLHLLATSPTDLGEKMPCGDSGRRLGRIEGRSRWRRRKRDRPFGRSLGEIEATETLIYGRQIIMSERRGGSTGDRDLELSLRLLESPELEKHRAPGDS
jgi:hypothetical protein